MKKKIKHRFDFSFKIAEFFFIKSTKLAPNYLALLNLTRLYFDVKTYDKSLSVALKAYNFNGKKDHLSEIEILMYLMSSKLRLSDYNGMGEYEESLKEKMSRCLEVKKTAMICSFNVQMLEYNDEFYHNYTRTSYNIKKTKNTKKINLEQIID